jgi:ABC-type branched-subunit amino acid transport system ATPase component
MNIKISNLGALQKAEFSLGDLTIICGGNNTGKTYATYALFGFLSGWSEGLTIDIPQQTLNQLLAEGIVHIDVSEYAKNAQKILRDGCKAYTKHLPIVFAAPEDRFKDSEFAVTIDTSDIRLDGEYERRMKAGNAELFYLTKAESSGDLVVTLLAEKNKAKLPQDMLAKVIGDALKDIIFGAFFPHPFIASAERTGAAIFRKELNFARNRLLEEMSQADKTIDPWELLFKSYQDYALPVKANVDFTRQLESLVKKNSFVADQHSEVLADFADIIGGEYKVTKNDELYYIPKGKTTKLTMDESSSAVRSLLDIGFYLKHMAKPGDLLMVDEPELNLHPENQRRVARLFARLVNLGIKVFITTHSDYIIKELNTLIMLNHDKPHLKQIAEREGYKAEELIAAEKIKVYIAEKALVKLDGGKNKVNRQTLTPADIDPMLGIEARSFDETIGTMNRIQEEIVWGGE